jgi:hypothetical protein
MMKRCRTVFEPGGSGTRCIRGIGHHGRHRSGYGDWVEPSSGESLPKLNGSRLEWPLRGKGLHRFVSPKSKDSSKEAK